MCVLLQTKYECGHLGPQSKVFTNAATQTDRVSRSSELYVPWLVVLMLKAVITKCLLSYAL